MPRTRLLAAIAPLALAAAVPASASAATAFYGVTADNHLVEFQSDNTSTVRPSGSRASAPTSASSALTCAPPTCASTRSRARTGSW